MGLNVVGESYYQENLWQAIGGRRSKDHVRVDVDAVLMAETDNPYDENAISVWVKGLKVGHLSREDASRYRPGLLALEQKVGKRIALPGQIVGGGLREDGPGMLGIFLRHEPADFGLRTPRPPASDDSRIRTGLSEAMGSDASGTDHHLSWMADLPEDPIRAISILRQLLKSERDPIERHFMFHNLEETLYRSRQAFSSALEEFDDCCRQHDAEMETIRAAFLAKWGDIPWLNTYKQMCIRLSKAKNFEEALRWAERGLSIYGDNAARPDAVEDLQERAEAYKLKLTH